ncbi:MAG: HAD-IC family P-type ATPase [Acutalibacteraceae bacterium]
MKRNAKLPPFAKRAEAAERYEPAPDRGLTDAQAAKRRDERLSNENASVQSKSYARILSDNLLTLFNVINLLLAVAVLAVGAYKNALFIGVVLCNAAIGIFQEIRAKRVVDKLSFLSQSQVTVIRDGEELSLPIDEVVLDDVLAFSNGSQVCADSIVLTGECEVNESFVTGESDAVFKKPGDLLLAGSFVVSGACRARADRVADGNYISRISAGAKYIKKETSQILAGLKRIIKIMSVIILPLGIALFLKEYSVAHDLTRTILGTAAALINMIPQGLMLLTSSALALGVVKLSRERVLVQDLYAIEMLARTDTLCLDKTGTLTEGRMEVVDLVPLRTGPDLETALRSLCARRATPTPPPRRTGALRQGNA